MNAMTLFMTEIASSTLIAFAVSRYLRAALSDCLELICGSRQARQFWLTFTHLMVLIVPLLCVVLFSRPHDIGSEHLAEALRLGLLQILLGIFVALLAVGWNIWRFADRVTRPEISKQTAPAIAAIRDDKLAV